MEPETDDALVPLVPETPSPQKPGALLPNPHLVVLTTDDEDGVGGCYLDGECS